MEPKLDAPEPGEQTTKATQLPGLPTDPTFTISEIDLKALIVTSFEEGYKTGRQMRFKKEVLEDVMHTFAARLIQVRPWEAAAVIVPPAGNDEQEPEAPTAPKFKRPDTPETSL